MVMIKIGNNGRLGNKMLQYMYCRRLQMLLPESQLGGFSLPEFGLLSETFELEGRILHIRSGHRHPIDAIAYQLTHGIYDALLFDGYVARLEYYPDRGACSALFTSRLITDRALLGPQNLTINVRGQETLRNTHADYYPVEVSFYEQIVKETKLEPVIMGQLGDDPYSDEIRRRFSGCTILPHHSAIADFEILRNSTNIALSVSTFSWLAAWLSDTAESIHMPLRGFLNPRQRPDVDLLPLRDARYRFYEFPVARWEATPIQHEGLLATTCSFQPITPAEARLLIA